MQCVKKNLIGRFKNKAIFHVILEIDRYIDSIDKFVKNAHNMSLSSQPPLQKKFNTVHNLIIFSIVFTNKNRGGGHFEPPPPPI